MPFTQNVYLFIYLFIFIIFSHSLPFLSETHEFELIKKGVFNFTLPTIYLEIKFYLKFISLYANTKREQKGDTDAVA
jgi:hypothetical protein